jgi:hypothetical protein
MTVLTGSGEPHVQCKVSDDGESIAAPRRDRGTEIVTDLAAKFGGSIAWKFGATGTTVVLKFALTQHPSLEHSAGGDDRCARRLMSACAAPK